MNLSISPKYIKFEFIKETLKLMVKLVPSTQVKLITTNLNEKLQLGIKLHH